VNVEIILRKRQARKHVNEKKDIQMYSEAHEQKLQHQLQQRWRKTSQKNKAAKINMWRREESKSKTGMAPYQQHY
jgi:hypothetical protein